MTLSSDPLEPRGPVWEFKGKTVHDFDTHIRQSIPLYEESCQLIGQLSDFFVKTDSLIYDIGCSLGTLTHQLASRHAQHPQAQWVGIDHEADMISYAKTHNAHPNITYITDDVCTYPFEPCDLVIAHYSLQFIHPKHRQNVINHLYQSLHWGGAFIFFEKVRGPDARFQDIATTLYQEYKLHKGFSASDILAKTTRLKGVLEPFSTQGNIDLLKRAGFQDITTFMKYICFEGFLAIK